MSIAFRISALQKAQFAELMSLTDNELHARGGRRVMATSKPGFPCRVSLEDAEVGERLLLIPFIHQPADSPYRASGPIFVREGARQALPAVGEVPPFLHKRLLSFRAYDASGMMVDAEVAMGVELESVVDRLLGNPEALYLHIHNAKPGCYSCRVDRV